MDASTAGSERRRHRRLSLQLPIQSLQGQDWATSPLTSDISSGGMYFVADAAVTPEVGQEIQFELQVPPGEGYWPRASRVAGRGQVVRVVELPNGRQGVALRFLQALALGLT